MNPKLTITVDAKNRALSVASGMITVGAKIDVEISGLPGDIPSWGASDAFSGPSVRFRLVDELGRDLARYPLAEGDRWEPSGGVLSSQTPVEFDTDGLRCAFCGVAFDDTLPFGVVVDSAVDAAQYAVGRVKVRQWAAASTEDPKVLPDWRETLERLQTDLAEVSEKRDDAVAAKAAAESAASEAQSSRNAAATSALAASSANDMAHASASDANDANAAAQKAKTDAEAARDRAEAASGDFDGRLKDYAKKSEVKEEVDAANAAMAAAVAKEEARAKEAEELNAESAARAGAKADGAQQTADAAQQTADAAQQAADAAQSATNGHVTDTGNPHAVTAEQVGALPATEDQNARYEVSHKVNFLSGLNLENRETGVRVPAMIDVGYNETEEALTFKFNVPPLGGSKIDFIKGSLHTFLEPDGSVVLTKNSADALYPTRRELNEKADKATTLAGYGITDAATKADVAAKADKSALNALAGKVDAANAALEEVA